MSLSDNDRITITEVAERAGVSIATVSRVMNRKGRYSQSTYRKVKAAARELGYVPDDRARGLKIGRTEQVALAVADIGNPVYVAMARAIQQCLKEYGYRLVLLSTEASVDEEIRIVRSLARNYVDGLIICPLLYGEPHKAEFLRARLPLVMIGGEGEQTPVDSVWVDSSLGMKLAVDHLLEQGYTGVAFVNGPVETVPGASRRRGYEAALIEHGLPFDEHSIVYEDFTLLGGYRAASRLLKRAELPQAVVAANDLMALGVLRRISEAGIRVPQDLAIVGMDDIEQARIALPALTSVSLQASERGRIAAELMLKRLRSFHEGEANNAPVRVQVSPRLVVRESSVTHRTL